MTDSIKTEIEFAMVFAQRYWAGTSIVEGALVILAEHKRKMKQGEFYEWPYKR